MASFEKINYNHRPNKSIERKMIGEAIQKLDHIDDLINYRYIGFGSTYFTDFILFHKRLGIEKMISIEKEEDKYKKLRIEFNKPFSCVDIKYGDSSTILPNLELDKQLNIVWLDYDDKISESVFSDIDSIVANTTAGSMFLVTLNTEPDSGDKDARLQNLIERVGRQRIPSEFLDLNFNNINYPHVVYEMVDRQIRKTILERTGGDPSLLEYFQLFHYLYKDGAQMITVGGILLDGKQKKHLRKMKFKELKHLSDNQSAYRIKCPNLTYKEVHYLNNLLPCTLEKNQKGLIKNPEFKSVPLNASDIENFAEVYRYYPNFSETNV